MFPRRDPLRKIVSLGRFFHCIASANDQQLGSLCATPFCIFKPNNQNELIELLVSNDLPVAPVQWGHIHEFHTTYWLAAWTVASQLPWLASVHFGISRELAETLGCVNPFKFQRFLLHCSKISYCLRHTDACLDLLFQHSNCSFFHFFQLHHIIQNEDEAITLGFASE